MLDFHICSLTVSMHIGSILSAPSKYHAWGPIGSGSETHHQEHRRSSAECWQTQEREGWERREGEASQEEPRRLWWPPGVHGSECAWPPKQVVGHHASTTGEQLMMMWCCVNFCWWNYVNVNSVMTYFWWWCNYYDEVVKLCDPNSITYFGWKCIYLYIIIYIVAGLSMAGVKMEEYKQIHQCFSNKNHIFLVNLVHITSFTQANSSKFYTSS